MNDQTPQTPATPDGAASVLTAGLGVIRGDMRIDFMPVRGFVKLGGRINADGKVTVRGEASVSGSTYFFTLEGRVDNGIVRLVPFSARWETWTGRSVRGKANVRLEELTEAAITLVMGRAVDMSVFTPNSQG